MEPSLSIQVFVFLIPFTAIVMGLGTGMLAIYFNYRKRKEMFMLYHQERMAAIEKGIELPPLSEDFFHENGRPSRRSPHKALLNGLIMLFIGLPLYFALHFTADRTDGGGDSALFALIPAGIGAAYLIYYFAVGRKIALTVEEERKARAAETARERNPAV
jgi:Domain of unknown function (DUF6249)